MIPNRPNRPSSLDFIAISLKEQQTYLRRIGLGSHRTHNSGRSGLGGGQDAGGRPARSKVKFRPTATPEKKPTSLGPMTRRTLDQKAVPAAIPRPSGGSMALASENPTHGGDHIPRDQPILIE